MHDSLAKKFLNSDIGKEWIKKKDYSEIYGCLGAFCAKHVRGVFLTSDSCFFGVFEKYRFAWAKLLKFTD